MPKEGFIPMTDTDFSAWIGRTESVEEDICLAQAQAAAATIDDTLTKPEKGSALPPLWHWFYFLPRVPRSLLDHDGHPQRGGFMPPIPYPRRMFAGARLRFHRLLTIGQPARREGVIRNIAQKSGRSGSLAFVTVGYTFYQQDEVCIEEEQDIVYREPGPPAPAPQSVDLPPVPEGAQTRACCSAFRRSLSMPTASIMIGPTQPAKRATLVWWCMDRSPLFCCWRWYATAAHST
jgi:3-methylfumaryl-CoA hydratase